jgi:hypothetical protein
VCCFGLESVADSRIIGRRTVELMLVLMLIASGLQTGASMGLGECCVWLSAFE